MNKNKQSIWPLLVSLVIIGFIYLVALEVSHDQQPNTHDGAKGLSIKVQKILKDNHVSSNTTNYSAKEGMSLENKRVYDKMDHYSGDYHYNESTKELIVYNIGGPGYTNSDTLLENMKSLYGYIGDNSIILINYINGNPVAKMSSCAYENYVTGQKIGW